MDNSEILALAESALADSWRRMKGDKCFRAKPVGYVNHPEDNLLPPFLLRTLRRIMAVQRVTNWNTNFAPHIRLPHWWRIVSAPFGKRAAYQA